MAMRPNRLGGRFVPYTFLLLPLYAANYNPLDQANRSEFDPGSWEALKRVALNVVEVCEGSENPFFS